MARPGGDGRMISRRGSCGEFQPGARVCDVAAKYGLILAPFRMTVRRVKGTGGADRCGPAFVPLVIEPSISDTAAVRWAALA